jgi:hypothetical protein
MYLLTVMWNRESPVSRAQVILAVSLNVSKNTLAVIILHVAVDIVSRAIRQLSVVGMHMRAFWIRISPYRTPSLWDLDKLVFSFDGI